MAIAGKVAPTYDGEWSESATYQQHTYVKYNGDCYISKKPSTGIVPTNEEYWFLALKNVTQEQYNALVNGTTPAGNASKLGGFTAKQVSESGARNLIPYPYYDSTKTTNGITYTDNGDGTITANGTATARADFCCSMYTNYPDGWIIPGIYTISSGRSDETVLTYRLSLEAWSKSDNSYAKNIGYTSNSDGKHIVTITEEDIENYYITPIYYIDGGITVNNLTFKPMLELGSIAHDFVPYHFGGAEHALDADTVDGYHASDFLPLTGGTLSGAIRIDQGQDVISEVFPWGIGAYLRALDKDDVTSYAEIIVAKDNVKYGTYEKGVVVKNTVLLNSGNVGSYALPLTGGEINWLKIKRENADSEGGQLILEKPANSPLEGDVYIDVLSDRLRFFEFGGAFRGATLDLSETGAVDHTFILHTGNSAKVAIQSSAPSDTSALWVDTANKVSKIYKDGAWTALA